MARAVALQETGNCTLGYGKLYNNCFGIKNGRTAPCKKMKGQFCIYDNPQESYEAFKKIWSTWYKGLPDINKANRWTGGDRPKIWLNNVLHFYNTL